MSSDLSRIRRNAIVPECCAINAKSLRRSLAPANLLRGDGSRQTKVRDSQVRALVAAVTSAEISRAWAVETGGMRKLCGLNGWFVQGDDFAW